MAGEIQLNSTTMATESSGSITLSNVNSATNRTNLGLGSMATQNANAVALTGGTLTGTEIDLKSSGTTIYKSDGTTAVLSESGGVVTLNNGTIGSGVVFPAGHVLQVVQATQISNTTVTTTTPTDITCSVSITPTNASSKIVIYAAVQIYVGTSSLFITSHLYKDSSTLGSAFEKVIYNDFGVGTVPLPLIGYETAGSTSTRSYSIRGSLNTTSSATWEKGVITVMEITA